MSVRACARAFGRGMDSRTRFSFPCSRKADAPRAMEATPKTSPHRLSKSCPERQRGRVTKLFGLALSDGALARGIERLRTVLAMPNTPPAFPFQFSFCKPQSIFPPRVMPGEVPLMPLSGFGNRPDQSLLARPPRELFPRPGTAFPPSRGRRPPRTSLQPNKEQLP